MTLPWTADADITPLTRTEDQGGGRAVEERLVTFAHPQTGAEVRVPHAVVIEDGRERVYYDGATVLVQAGLLDPEGLPICGAEQARKAVDPRGAPTNTLMARWSQSAGDQAPPPPEGAPAEPADEAATLDAHLAAEFATKDIGATMATMTADPYLNHVPVMTGGVGWAEVHRFYRNHFIPGWPDDVATQPVSRTVGDNRVIDELIVRYTHDREMDAIIPGVPPTHQPVELPHVVVVGFEDGRVAYEHIYWDQESALRQIGLLQPGDL
jgi:carboxymethylenebutenolidase